MKTDDSITCEHCFCLSQYHSFTVNVYLTTEERGSHVGIKGLWIGA